MQDYETLFYDLFTFRNMKVNKQCLVPGEMKNARSRDDPSPSADYLMKTAASKPKMPRQYGAKVRKPRKTLPPISSIVFDTSQMFAAIFERKSPELLEDQLNTEVETNTKDDITQETNDHEMMKVEAEDSTTTTYTDYCDQTFESPITGNRLLIISSCFHKKFWILFCNLD